ncbi:hypothetical protein [Micromonospora sp. NPDC048830]|uniref:hypothetical protein n=1 Tax=Micromonospora sp. NPDC048830 TaxID=3364257 RepID=UPI003722105F
MFVHCLGVLAAVPALPATAPKTTVPKAAAAAATAAETTAAQPVRTAVATAVAAATPTAAVAPTTPGAATVPTTPGTASVPTTPGTASVPTTPGTASVPTGAPSARPAAATEEPTDTPSPSDSAVPTPAAPPPLVSPSVVVPTQGAPPPVTVAVAPAGTPAPGYRIEVRNQGSLPVTTTVRQELPAGTRATWITPGGRASRAAGQAATTEVTWQLKLPARGSTTLHTALAAVAPGRPLSAPACAFTNDGNRAYDCATATWNRPMMPAAAKVTEAAVWRRPPVLLGALAGVLLLTMGGLWWWQRRRRRRAEIRAGIGAGAGTGVAAGTAGTAGAGAGTGVAAGTAGTAGAEVGAGAAATAGAEVGAGAPGTAGAEVGAGAPGTAGRGVVYSRPVAAARHRPPVWLVVAGAATLLAGVVFAAALTASQRVAAIDTNKQPTSGAWLGQSATGAIGVPLRESAFEFTVYRLTCPPDGGGGGRRCLATVGVRNVTPQQQTWHGQMQRAYLPGGNWVSTDEQATRQANQGRDVFAQPLAAGARMVLPLVFTVGGTAQPKQLELRSGVFSAGVRVDVP